MVKLFEEHNGREVMFYYDSTETFAESIKEVLGLYSILEEGRVEEFRRIAISKSVILLLAAKVEAFVEGVVEDFCHSIALIGVYRKNLSKEMYAACLEKMFSDASIDIESGKVNKFLKVVAVLENVLCKNYKFEEISVVSKFSYGKHGDKEVVKIFKRVGIENIFDECAFEKEESGEVRIDNVRPYFNSMTAIRNNIIHSDASPTLSLSEICNYIDVMLAFSLSIDDRLKQLEEQIESHSKLPSQENLLACPRA